MSGFQVCRASGVFNSAAMSLGVGVLGTLEFRGVGVWGSGLSG